MRLRSLCLVWVLLFAPFAQAKEKPRTSPPKEIVRTARLSLRVLGNGEDAYLEIPLVPSDGRQRVLSEKLETRGFSVQEVEREGNRLAILTHPAFTGRKRITYEVTVLLRSASREVSQAPVSNGDPSHEDWVWLRPTRQLQSTSPIIREKLIAYASPRLEAGETDAIRLCWDLVQSGYRRKADGSRTVLKATRTGHASDKGLERLFATFLRTSGVPARPVLGLDLRLSQKKRSITWVEVKSGGDWVPMSVSKNLWGRLPARSLKLAHGDRPFVVRSGVESVRYRWKVTKAALPAEAAGAEASAGKEAP